MKLLPAPDLPHSAKLSEMGCFHLTVNTYQRKCTNLRKTRLGRKKYACKTLSAQWSTRELQHSVPWADHINQNQCLNTAVTSYWYQQLIYTHEGELAKCTISSGRTYPLFLCCNKTQKHEHLQIPRVDTIFPFLFLILIILYQHFKSPLWLFILLFLFRLSNWM